MNFNNLNWVTVLLLVLNLTEITQLSYWIVFAPTILWAGLLLAVITMGLIVMVSNGLSMAEFNKLIEIKIIRRRMMNRMTINYTEVFNNVLQQKVSQQTKREQLVEEVEGHLVELEGILDSVVNIEQFKHTNVEYRTSEKLLCMECHAECMEIKFDAEQMQMSIADKVVSFKDEEAIVEYKNKQDVYVSRDADGNIVFDLGADNRSVSEFYTHIVERAAEMVSRG